MSPPQPSRARSSAFERRFTFKSGGFDVLGIAVCGADRQSGALVCALRGRPDMPPGNLHWNGYCRTFVLATHGTTAKAGRSRPGSSARFDPSCVRVEPSTTGDLERHKIDWFPGTAEDFANDILSKLKDEAQRGFAFFAQYDDRRASDFVPLVSELASQNPKLHTEYLLGEEPLWADLLTGRAIERSHDRVLSETAWRILDGQVTNTAVAVTGTAGTGKSTALMSLALSLTNKGVPVLWVDRDSEVTVRRIRNRAGQESGRLVLVIDDADLFGADLISRVMVLNC